LCFYRVKETLVKVSIKQLDYELTTSIT